MGVTNYLLSGVILQVVKSHPFLYLDLESYPLANCVLQTAETGFLFLYEVSVLANERMNVSQVGNKLAFIEESLTSRK